MEVTRLIWFICNAVIVLSVQNALLKGAQYVIILIKYIENFIIIKMGNYLVLVVIVRVKRKLNEDFQYKRM